MSTKACLSFIGAIGIFGVEFVPSAPAATIYAALRPAASDENPGTAERPVRSVSKAVSLAKPRDTVVFSPGSYPCSQVSVPDGRPDLPIMLRSDGKGRVIFTN